MIQNIYKTKFFTIFFIYLGGLLSFEFVLNCNDCLQHNIIMNENTI